MELFVDNFAGGGGASTGIETAIGRSVDIAINHDPDAIAMHKANHPKTKHYCENIWQVDPKEACGENSVALAWFSPDCTHFSRAKGGKPVDKNIRGLSWVVVKWAITVQPKVIMMENVPEIQTWGPLIPATDRKTGRVLKIVGYGHKKGSRHGAPKTVVAEPGEIVPAEQCLMVPDPARKGETFEGFILALTTGLDKNHPAFKECCEALEISEESKEAEIISQGLGYDLQWKVLKSCDYGAPTTRTRFYLIARCDGKSIVWPEATHAPRKSADVICGKKLPFRTAAECIDWSVPATSIFERKKPLAENTLRRIARGIKKFVIDNPEPFIIHYKFENEPESVNEPLSTVTAVNSHYVAIPNIVTVNHSGDEFRGQDINEPLNTVTAKNGYGLVTPTIMCNNTGNNGAAIDDPCPTVTTGNRNYLVAPTITAIGQQSSSSCRTRSADEPLSTVVSKNEHILIAPSIVPIGYGEHKKQQPRVNDIEEPLGTVVSSGKHYLCAPTLIQYHSETVNDEVRGQDVQDPIKTVDTRNRYALSVAHIMKNYGGGYTGAGSDAKEPLDTVTAKDHNSLVTAHIMTMRNNMDGQKVDEPLTTISCSGAHLAEVQAFLVKYFSGGAAKSVQEPLDTVTTRDRFGLVTIHGEEYIITDIKMRMLEPRELFRAQGFPEDYIIEHDADGNPYPRSKQVARCGNAVTPPVPAALVRANLPEYCV